MFDRLKTLIADRSAGGSSQEFSESDYRLAAVALFVHVAEADGRIVEAEHLRMRSLIVSRFGLDDAAGSRLLIQAERSDHEIADMSHFTGALKRMLSLDDRRKILDMLCEVAFADGHLHEFEDSAIWRVADLLEIPQTDLDDLLKRNR